MLHSLDSSKYQIQSCVVISHFLYCSLWLHETTCTVYIYEVDLLPLWSCDKEYYEGSLPERSWVIEDLFMKSCFLSAFKEEVVITTFKNINDRTVMEVRLINSMSVTSAMPKLIRQYNFASVVKVVTASAICGVPNTITVIYHDDKANKCVTMRLHI